MGNTESTLPAEDQSDTENAHTNRNSSRRRRHRRITLESASTADNDCPWWSKIENESLALDVVANTAAEAYDSERAAAAAAAILAHDEIDALLRKYEHVNVVAAIASDSTKQTDQLEQRTPTPTPTPTTTSTIDEQENPAEQTNIRAQKSASPSSAREQSLEEFKEELRVKRLARQTAVLDLRDEITTLRQQLANEQALTRRLRSSDSSAENANADDIVAVVPMTRLPKKPTAIDCDAEQSAAADDVDVDADDDDPLSRSRHANIALANVQLALQLSQAENLSLRTELGVVQKQVGTLKEVIVCCKQMLTVKEEQCVQLKSKLQEIENSFGEREMKIMSSNLRQEYERQLLNIRQLRQLYEERQRIAAAEQENLQRLISIKKDELQAEQEKTKNYEERNQTLVKEVENANIELATLREECNEHKFEKKALKEEMGAINTLFTQMVMGFNGKNNLDIDRLTAMLEENRTLLNEMTTKEANCSDGATLPKLLFELVEQAAVVNKKSSRSPTPTMPALVSDAEHDNENDNENDDGDGAGNGNGESDADADAGAGAAADVDVGNAACGTTPTAAAEVIIGEEHGAAANVQHMMDKTLATQQNIKIADNAKDDEKQLLGAMALCNNDDSSSTNNNNCNIDNVAASAATNNTKTCNKKHVRRTYGSKNKTLATAAATTTTTTKLLNFPDAEVMGKVASAQEIIGNLPKVWKVLMELLSHHKIEQVQFEENGAGEDCYKSVETANGPKAELSVSKTYIKLKDLILEKKSLMKETNRLKTLNSHLDYRLNEQEKRLSAVSLELTKTWHLVGKMQRQHRQLHTQEQILRYQLQQKRRLLSELKDELEYCRRKWAAARAKNDESQEQCNDLRREFAQRKLDDASHSAESGYSDSGPASDEEERNGVAAAAAVAAAASADAAASACNVVSVVGAVYSGGATATSACTRRKHLKEMFEHTRKIKRMQSTSPGRAAGAVPADNEEIVLRWNSAPPTCGWRSIDGADDDDVLAIDDNDEDDDDADEDDDDDDTLANKTLGEQIPNRGAIPKSVSHNSRSKQRTRTTKDIVANAANINAAENGNLCATNTVPTVERATRIQRLEEQCKSLIQKVLETSDNRERLEIQLCHFQDDVAPVQYAMPLDELINHKRLDRMTRASSAPATGSLTPREEEYTRKRSERLERLEEESRQLMSRIKRTSDRGHYLRCSLDRIRRAPPREDSCESNTEDELTKEDDLLQSNISNVQSVAEPMATEQFKANESPLTADEEAYTARRAARLQRLEAESRDLLNTLARQTERGGSMDNKLDNLHERYGSPTTKTTTNIHKTNSNQNNVEQRLQNIEQISLNREERLRLLEEEGKALLSRLTNTSERGTQMINRIAERELNRQKRDSSTPKKENISCLQENPEEVIFNNIACSSIVDEALADGVLITTTSTQIAAQQGAIPKTSKPPTELSVFARSKTTRQQEQQPTDSKEVETLEDMVRRLKDLPFPSNSEDSNGQQSSEATNDAAAASPDTSSAANSSEPAEQS